MTAAVVLDPRPGVRDSVLVFSSDDTLTFLLTSSSTVRTYRTDELGRSLVALLDGTRTPAELDVALADVPGYSSERVRELLAFLRSESLLRGSDASCDGPGSVSSPRYDRQLRLLQDVCDEQGSALTGHDLQARLRGARVVVVGTGGTGSWLLTSLAMVGVGTLRICDFDTVELSNLNRQVLFTSADIGRDKSAAAAERLSLLNPDVSVEPVVLRLDEHTDLEPVIAGADLVVNCADRPSTLDTSGWISRACLPRGVPHIVGGSYAYERGVLGTTVLPGRSPCWPCLQAVVGNDLPGTGAALLGPRGPGASLAPLTAVIANVLAWESVRLLTGMPPLLAGRWGEIDFSTLQVGWREFRARSDCPTCQHIDRRPQEDPCVATRSSS
jgi:molybdopterin/thiamine biosynthesis adenylyltransferase